eukprot:734677-Pyramimonas_sp.AAC.1
MCNTALVYTTMLASTAARAHTTTPVSTTASACNAALVHTTAPACTRQRRSMSWRVAADS